MAPAYAAKLSLKICSTNVEAQKIDGLSFRTFGILIASFQVNDRLGRARFFEESFLLANISMKMVLGMPFLTFNIAKI